MKKIYYFIILVILISIGLYFKYTNTSINNNNLNNNTNLNISNDKLEHFSTNFDPHNPPNEKNVAYLSFICDDKLSIYHDKGSNSEIGGKNQSTKIGEALCCDTLYQFIVNEFNYGDRLLFYLENTGGPGYMAGHIWWNGKVYTTDNNNFRIRSVKTNTSTGTNGFIQAGKRIGCYRDNQSRKLQYNAGNNLTNEECRDIAIKRDHPYYGLQYGGECYTGTDLNKATSLGKLDDSECQMNNTKVPGTEKSGGFWANDIHSTFESPNIRMCGRANKNFLHKDAFLIKSEQGPDCNSNDLWEIEYEWQPKDPPIIQFCSDPDFTEFYPVGCSNPNSKTTCESTVIAGFEANKDKCKNKFSVDYNDYENEDFYKMINEAWQITRRPSDKQPHNIQDFSKNLRESINETVELCCKLLNTKDEYFDTDNCIKNNKDQFNSTQYYDLVRKANNLCRTKDLKENTFICDRFKESLKKTGYNARTIVSLDIKPTAQFLSKLNNKKFQEETVRKMPVPKPNQIKDSICENKFTNWDIVGGWRTNYLDRQQLSCGSNQVLNSFKLETNKNNGTARYSYKCCPVEDTNNSLNFTKIEKNTDWNDPGGWNTIYLDRHYMDCRPESAINSFRLQSKYRPDQVRYNYSCLKTDSADDLKWTCNNKTTDWKPESSSFDILENHSVDCPNGEAISDFRYYRDGMGYSKITYKCCKPSIGDDKVKKPDTTGNWRCVNGVNVPLNKNEWGDVQCMSTDGRNCLWQANENKCTELVENKPGNIRPLVCGGGHQRAWGSRGYDSGPGHWCNKGMEQIK